MRECMDRIREYAQAERARFEASRLVQDAVVRNLQTLAESSQRLSSEIKGTEPARAVENAQKVMLEVFQRHGEAV